MATSPGETHKVRILRAEYITHNVRQFRLSKPPGYRFTPGQATEISIPQAGWEEERRPFTFTSLNEWDTLEFTIKIYPERQGVTARLGQVREGEELLLHEVFGTIHYQGEGVFIAGGAGVTPFIAILRQLHREGKLGRNHLLFSNRTEKDIILKEEFSRMLGDHFHNTLTQEADPRYDHRKIDAGYLREQIPDFSGWFYLCGPDPMVAALQADLTSLGAAPERIVLEQF